MPLETITIDSPMSGDTQARSFTVEGTFTKDNGTVTVAASGVATGTFNVNAPNFAWSQGYTATADGSCTVTANAPSSTGASVTFTAKDNPELTFNAPTLSGGTLTVSGQCTLSGVSQVDVWVAKRNGATLGTEQTQRVNVTNNAFSAAFNSMTAGTYRVRAQAVGGTLKSSKVATV